MVYCVCFSSVLRSTPFTTKVYQVLNGHQNFPCLYHSFKYSDLEIKLKNVSERKPKPDMNNLSFGKNFSDHMLEIEWCEDKGWGKPLISPMHDLIFHPASKVLHYAQELFEGLKAFKTKEGKVSLFRPELNMQRMLKSAERASLPCFDGTEFLKCLKKLISIDQDWVPHDENCSLYIRPTFIGTEEYLPSHQHCHTENCKAVFSRVISFMKGK